MSKTQISYPIIRTKLHRPQISKDHLLREHLLNRLNNHQCKPLILVSAPAGYGKSTLVSCWLETCVVPSAWISLDENENDLRLFLTYFISAIQQIFPASCGETLSMLRAAHLPPVQVLAENLINEIDKINREFILVLDDYYLIRDKSIHGMVTKLLAHPSPLMSLILISRRDPPLPLATLRARGQMIEIRTQDLRFSLEETAVFLQQMTGSPVDNLVAALLEEKTEGWVTGLRLAALSLRHHENLKGVLRSLPAENRYVMDYVISEILSQYSPGEQKCLLKTSILNRFCAPLCEVVCGSNTDSNTSGSQGRDLMELLNKEDLFIIPLDNEQEWFRYHHLFQALLKRHLKKRFNAKDILRLYKQASAWFNKNGYIEEAFTYAFESGDKQAALQLMKQHWHDAMNHEQWYDLDRWLQRFPAEFIQEQPYLLLVKAWIYQRQACYSKLFDLLTGLEQSVSTEGKESSIDNIFQGELQVLKSFQYYSTAQAELAETFAREAMAQLPTRFYSSRGFSLIILALALQMQGKHGQAQNVVHEALQQEDASIAIYKTMLLAALCYTNWIGADLNNLKLSAKQLLKHGQKHNLPETITVGRFFAGIFHYQRNKLDLAEHYLAPIASSPVAGELVVPSIVTYCQGSLALSLTYQAMGRTREAGEIVETLLGYMLETGNTDLLEICQAFQAELSLRNTHFAEADLWAKSYIQKPVAPAYRFFSPYLTLPKVLLARGTAQSLGEADKLLSRIYEYYVSIHSTRVLIDILALQALLYNAQDDRFVAIKKLEEALGLAKPGCFIRPFLDLGAEMEDLLSLLVKQKPTLQYARHTLAAFGKEKTGTFRGHKDVSMQASVTLQVEDLAEPLTNREIEVLMMLPCGISNNEIADRLYISPETVKRHLSTIYRKLDVKNRHQAVNSAKSIGIL